VISSIAFRNFRALRNTRVALSPFNVVIGPNGSGKTSLIEAIVRLRTLSRLGLSGEDAGHPLAGGPEIEVEFDDPFAGVVVRMGCVSDIRCDTLRIDATHLERWPELRADLGTIRSYVLDHDAMAGTAKRTDGVELGRTGGNLAAVLASLRTHHAVAYAGLTGELLRLMPEFQALELLEHPDGEVEFGLRLQDNGLISAMELSQGMIYLVGILALAFDPNPPRLLCIEEVDRGIHPRMLREIRDVLYRLSYPGSFALNRRPVQVITTSHSPYFIDLFRDHPEEVVISHKHGRAATFSRLVDRPDLPELLREGSLGDMWFSGILGGVPEE